MLCVAQLLEGSDSVELDVQLGVALMGSHSRVEGSHCREVGSSNSGALVGILYCVQKLALSQKGFMCVSLAIADCGQVAMWSCAVVSCNLVSLNLAFICVEQALSCKH